MLVLQSRTESSMKNLQKNKTLFVYVIAVFLFLCAIIFGLFFGSTSLSLTDVISSIRSGNSDDPSLRIFLFVRLPRVLACLVCGMALAVSGAVIQSLFANKLASPSIIGVNAGAGLAVTLCAAFGILGGWMLSLFSFFGALLTVLLVSAGAKKWGASKGTVVLIGVAVNAFLGAVSDTVTTIAPETAVMANDFKIGDFSFVTYTKLIPAAVLILLSVVVLQAISTELDVLTLGDEQAKSLGLNIGVMRVVFLIFAALLAGAAVSICGLVSFVGLLVPHAVRSMTNHSSKHLITLSALVGGGFVTLCDMLARTLFAPYELPVGIVLAFLGAPFFIWILIKSRGGHRNA